MPWEESSDVACYEREAQLLAQALHLLPAVGGLPELVGGASA